MARDALDPGEDGSFPAFPRRSDGTPYWSDSPLTDGLAIVVNGVTVAPMPRGLRHVLRARRRIAVDVTPRGSGGVPINPPKVNV